MTDKLKIKLRHILDHFSEDSKAVYGEPKFWEGYVEKAIADIEQAFKAAGHVDLHGEPDFTGMLKAVEEKFKRDAQAMSGKEWYDRLLLEVDTNRYHESDPEYAAQQEVLRAAKRAAGLVV